MSVVTEVDGLGRTLIETGWFRVDLPAYPKSQAQRQERVDLARDNIGNHEKYNIYKYNCEHFVSDVLLGEKTSKQVDIVKYYAIILFIILVKVLAIILVCHHIIVWRLLKEEWIIQHNSILTTP